LGGARRPVEIEIGSADEHDPRSNYNKDSEVGSEIILSQRHTFIDIDNASSVFYAVFVVESFMNSL
jgi:hypothetical protein